MPPLADFPADGALAAAIPPRDPADDAPVSIPSARHKMLVNAVRLELSALCNLCLVGGIDLVEHDRGDKGHRLADSLIAMPEGFNDRNPDVVIELWRGDDLVQVIAWDPMISDSRTKHLAGQIYRFALATRYATKGVGGTMPPIEVVLGYPDPRYQRRVKRRIEHHDHLLNWPNALGKDTLDDQQALQRLQQALGAAGSQGEPATWLRSSCRPGVRFVAAAAAHFGPEAVPLAMVLQMVKELFRTHPEQVDSVVSAIAEMTLWKKTGEGKNLYTATMDLDLPLHKHIRDVSEARGRVDALADHLVRVFESRVGSLSQARVTYIRDRSEAELDDAFTRALNGESFEGIFGSA